MGNGQFCALLMWLLVFVSACSSQSNLEEKKAAQTKICQFESVDEVNVIATFGAFGRPQPCYVSNQNDCTLVIKLWDGTIDSIPPYAPFVLYNLYGQEFKLLEVDEGKDSVILEVLMNSSEDQVEFAQLRLWNR